MPAYIITYLKSLSVYAASEEEALSLAPIDSIKKEEFDIKVRRV